MRVEESNWVLLSRKAQDKGQNVLRASVVTICIPVLFDWQVIGQSLQE